MHNTYEQLKNQFHENKLSHAFLLETNDFKKTLDMVYEFVKIINCFNEYVEGCNKCNICHLIDTNNLPSLIYIEPDGGVIKKEQLLNLKNAFKTKPVFSKYNVYIIMHAECLNSSSANTILKFLEEPDDNIIGFFICNNKENVINTIQSRCQCFSNFYEVSYSINEDDLSTCLSFIKQLENNKENTVLFNKDYLIDYIVSRDDLVKFFKNVYYIYFKYYSMLVDRFLDDIYNLPFLLDKNLDYLEKRLILIKKYLERANYNVNILFTLDSFVLEMTSL